MKNRNLFIGLLIGFTSLCGCNSNNKDIKLDQHVPLILESGNDGIFERATNKFTLIYPYNIGDTVDLDKMPTPIHDKDRIYTFDYWENEDSQKQDNFVITKATKLVAKYKVRSEKRKTITFSGSNYKVNGIEPSKFKKKFFCGDKLNYTLTPDEGYSITNDDIILSSKVRYNYDPAESEGLIIFTEDELHEDINVSITPCIRHTATFYCTNGYNTAYSSAISHINITSSEETEVRFKAFDGCSFSNETVVTLISGDKTKAKYSKTYDATKQELVLTFNELLEDCVFGLTANSTSATHEITFNGETGYSYKVLGANDNNTIKINDNIDNYIVLYNLDKKHFSNYLMNSYSSFINSIQNASLMSFLRIDNSENISAAVLKITKNSSVTNSVTIKLSDRVLILTGQNYKIDFKDATMNPTQNKYIGMQRDNYVSGSGQEMTVTNKIQIKTEALNGYKFLEDKYTFEILNQSFNTLYVEKMETSETDSKLLATVSETSTKAVFNDDLYEDYFEMKLSVEFDELI